MLDGQVKCTMQTFLRTLHSLPCVVPELFFHSTLWCLRPNILNNSLHSDDMLLIVWPLEITCSYYLSYYNNKKSRNEHTHTSVMLIWCTGSSLDIRWLSLCPQQLADETIYWSRKSDLGRTQFQHKIQHDSRSCRNCLWSIEGKVQRHWKETGLKIYNACNVIAASCILRNYCGMLNDFFDDKWLGDVHILAGVCPGDPNQSQNTNAIAIRDAVKRLSM